MQSQRTQGNQSLRIIQRHPPEVHPRFQKQNIHGKKKKKKTPFLDGTEAGGGKRYFRITHDKKKAQATCEEKSQAQYEACGD